MEGHREVFVWIAGSPPGQFNFSDGLRGSVCCSVKLLELRWEVVD